MNSSTPTDSEIRWLTNNQVEMKLRLGVKGAVCSLYEGRGGLSSLGFNQTSYSTITTDLYIPEHRRLTLTSVQAANLLEVIQRKVPEGEASQLVPETKYYGPQIYVSAWGIVYKDQLYIFRFSATEQAVCQIWCILEGSTDFVVNEDPVINYVLSLPYLPICPPK